MQIDTQCRIWPFCRLTGVSVAPSLSHRLMHFWGSMDWYSCLLNGSSPHPTAVVAHCFIWFNLVRLLATAGDDCVTGGCFGSWEHCFGLACPLQSMCRKTSVLSLCPDSSTESHSSETHSPAWDFSTHVLRTCGSSVFLESAHFGDFFSHDF